MTIDEIFASMPEEDAATGRDFLVIDPAARSITVPASERVFGVEGDEDAARKYFICPRYVGDNLDLAGMFLTVYWRNANGDADGYMVEDVQTKGEYVTFSWLLSEKAVAYKGAVQFAVCADLPNTAAKRRPDWNTTLAEGEVLEGMDPDLGDLETGSSDVLTQLREMVTAQTAAVEATGAAQVDVVEAAGAAAAADAQAQIEAKGAATLATIPEDYTTMAGKVNEQANAIKGHLAGEIIRADDVSPVEHFLGVTVRPKNLFNTGKFEPAEDQTGSIYVSAVEAGAITLYCSAEHNGYYSTGLRLREVCRGLEPGKTYTLSAATEATGREYMYLHGANVTWWYGKPQTVTEEMLDSTIVLYSINGKNAGGGFCTISNIQIEEGAEATEYTPYIDPAGVTVTRCGKNILPWPYYDGESSTTGGITYTVQQDGGIHAAGTATANSYYRVMRRDLSMLPRVLTGCTYDAANLFTYVTVFKGETVDKVFYPQVELGEVATGYEKPAAQQEAMPDESGTVEGLTSVAPTMSIFADTDNVTVECEYNRDSNAVYAELLAKIAALSGTT